MMWREPLVLASLLLAAGCGAAPPPPPPLPEAPAGTAATAPTAAPRPTTSAAAKAAPDGAPPPAQSTHGIPIPPRLTEPLAPLTRTFTTVTLPGVKESIAAVEGRGLNDVWFLTDEQINGYQIGSTTGGEVLQYDGKRVKSHGHACTYSTFRGLSVSRDAVVVVGTRPWSRGVHPAFRASLVKDRTWNCEEDRGGHSLGITTSSGEQVWELSCDHMGCRLEASGGPSAPLPSEHPSLATKKKDSPWTNPVQALWMRGPGDGWMVRTGVDQHPWLFRYNGVDWTPLARLGQGWKIEDMWGDETDVWMVLHFDDDAKAPARDLVRWNGRALSLQAVPDGFEIRSMHAAHGRDVWFYGVGRTLYQWDGTQLRQGDAPFEVVDLWAGPGGELWLVGPTVDSGGPPVGVVARALPLPAAAAPAGKVTP